MKSFNLSQRAVAFVFLLTIFAYFFFNVNVQRHDIAYGLRRISPPGSVLEYTAKIREAEDAVNGYIYRRKDMVNLYSYLQVLLGKEENGGFDLVKSIGGSLNYGDFYHETPDGLEEYALRMRALKDYANSAGCEVFFLNTTPMYVEGLDVYTSGLPYQNNNIVMDSMLFFLQSYGVDYLDARPVLKKSGLPLEKYRYKTDGHWTVEAGFEVFGAIVAMLEDKYGESVDPDGFFTDPGNYSSTVYPNSMAGLLGERAGLPFSGRDDFTLIVPGFPTSFTAERNDGGEITRLEGDFSETMIDGDYLSGGNMYNAYLGGLAPFRHIVNHNNQDGLKILFLSDSFSLPPAAFLASAVSELDMIYTRSQEVFGYSVDIGQYLEANVGGYDYIIVELEPSNFSDSGFSFFESR